MINLVPTDEQRELAGSVAAFLAQELPLSRFYPVPEARPNDDGAQWERMAGLGYFGIGLGEDAGGVGYGLLEEMLLFREFGRFAVTTNVLATVLAAHVAAKAGRNDLAQNLASGVERASLALPLDHHLASPPPDAEHHLIDGADSSWALVWNRQGAGLVARNQLTGMNEVGALDWTLPLARTRLGKPSIWIDDASIFRRAGVLISALLVGLAEAARDDSVAYAKVREQFGQPIGSFQSVKHRCADMAARAEAAWCLVLLAGLSENYGQADADFQISSARMIAGDAALKNASANVQNHGASGFTAELEAHILLKRTHTLLQVGGDTQAQQRILMRQPAPV